MAIEWIPVSERLPDDDRAVLVWVEDLEESSVAWRGYGKWICTAIGGADIYDLPSVTHWAEINPPIEEELSRVCAKRAKLALTREKL